MTAMFAVAALSEQKKDTLLLLDWASRGSKDRPPTAVLIEFGLKDKTPEKWSGRAVVNGAKVVHREGYRFRPEDKLLDKDRWEASSHRGLRVPPRNPGHRAMEAIATVGVVLHLSDIQADASSDHRAGERRHRESQRRAERRAGGTDKDLWGAEAGYGSSRRRRP